MEELKRRGIPSHHLIKNYHKKGTDNEPSWQHELDDALADPELRQIWVVAANSIGKSFKIAHLIVQILHGDCKFNDTIDDPVWVHVIVKEFKTLRDTIQNYIQTITNYEISAYTTSKKFHVVKHANTITEIRNIETNVRVTFNVSGKGDKGNVGVRPHLLIADEPFPESLFQELTVRTTIKGSKFLMLATVYHAEHAWVALAAQKILEEKPPTAKVITARMLDVPPPFVDDGVCEHLKNILTEEHYQIRVLGSIDVISGIVYEGIEKCIIDDDYIPEMYKGLHPADLEEHFIWAESQDYGIGKRDPFIVGYFRIWDTGEIVQEDEIFIEEGNISDWADAIHRKRADLNMPYITAGVPAVRVMDSYIENGVCKGTKLYVRRPNICIGDKQYLAKRVLSSSKLKLNLARRKIYVQPSKGDKIETTLPVCQQIVKTGCFKIKERCKRSIKMARSYIIKASEASGKYIYSSPHDHWSDIFRYLIERIGNMNLHVRNIQSNLEFEKNINLAHKTLGEIDKKYKL